MTQQRCWTSWTGRKAGRTAYRILMILTDVNVLLYAFRPQAPDHQLFRSWLDGVINGSEAYGYADAVLSSFLRIATNPVMMTQADVFEDALAFTQVFRGQPHAVRIAPGERHWAMFVELCRASGAKGNLIPDAYLAALAIESGSEWVTTDGDFARFPGLRWRRPF